MAITDTEQLSNLLSEESQFNQLGNLGFDFQQEGALGQTDASSVDQKLDPVNQLTENKFVQSLQGTPAPVKDPVTGVRIKQPKGISAGNPSLNPTPAPREYKNNTEFLDDMNNQMRKNMLFETGYGSAKYTPTKIVEKYDDQEFGFIYGIDNDDFYGQREAWYTTGLKAIPRLGMGIINKIGMGTGFVAGLLNPWNWGEAAITDTNLIDLASDNAMHNLFEGLDEWTKNEWLPTFQEAADRNKGFWHRVGTDGDFWADDFVDGLSFLAAAWIPGAALGEMGAGAAMAARISRMGRALGMTGELTAAEIGQASAVSKWFTETGKLAKNLDAFNSWAIATSSEAMFEAAEVKKSILESPDYDQFGDPILNPKTGRPFTQDEKKKLAAQGALNTFLMNTAVLGVSNVFEYKFFSKLLGRADVSAASKYLNPGAALGDEVTVKALDPFWKTAAKQVSLGTLREGFYEENMQLAIQRYNTDYGTSGKIGTILDPDTWLSVANQFGAQTKFAITGQDKEAALSIGLGGMIGGIFGTYTSRKGEKREYEYANKMAIAISNADNSFRKFGNIFKTEVVDATDVNGNPIKTSKVVYNDKGQPEIDYDKVFTVAGLMLNNANQLDDSIKEIGKYKQDLLRKRAWVDFANSYFNAGLEKTFFEKLDKLEKADPEALVKLGFVKNENFQEDFETFKSIARQVADFRKQVDDTVLFRNNSFFESKNVVDNNRRAHLLEIGGRQIVANHINQQIKNDLTKAKSSLITDDMTSLSDDIVDQLNDLQYRIQSQEETIDYIKKQGKDKTLPMSVFEKVLENLKTKQAELLKQNEETVKNLKKFDDGYFRYEKDGRNDPFLRTQLFYKQMRINETLNEIANDSGLISLYSDPITGKENYTKFFNAVVEEQTRAAEEKIQKEKEKEEKKQAAEKLKKETEHKVVQEADGTFSVISPDGSVVLENISTKEDAEQKAAQLTASLVAKKEEELKKQEQEAKKKQPKKDPQTSLEDKKKLLEEKEKELDGLAKKGALAIEPEVQRLIDDERLTRDDAQLKAHNEWLKTEDGKKYNQLLGEYLKLKEEIEKEEKFNESVPTLEEYLKEIYNDLSEDPEFKFTYDEWIERGKLGGSINLIIDDYNKKYSKSEKPFAKKPTGKETIDDEIDALDLKDATFKQFKLVGAIIQKLYQKIKGDQNLLTKLIDKINEIKDDALKTSLNKLLENKSTSSEYIPLSSVGVNLNIQEHIVFDRINMSEEEAQLGFTLIGSKSMLEALSGSTGDLTHLVKAIASIQYVEEAQAMLDGIDVPNRTLITYETPKDISNLNKGLSVIAKYRKSDGFNLQLFLKDGSTANIYVGGIGNYAIVHPDNTTEKIEWREDQREFVMENMLVNGEKMTNDQYDKFAETYKKMQFFEDKINAFLNENLENSADDKSIDITDFFKETFTLSNTSSFFTEAGESFEEVVKKAAAADKLFPVLVMDESDNVDEKLLPLFAYYSKTAWAYEFPLNPGERIVTIDQSGQVLPVTSIKDYLKEQLGLSVEMTESFPGAYAWISKAENERGYTPYKLSRNKGTETPQLFKKFAQSFKELKEAIDNGLASDTNTFTFRGETYNSLPNLLKAYNIKHYGFFQYGGLVANISYNPKSRGKSGETVGKFLIEIRPQDKDERAVLDANPAAKKAFNMYISVDPIMKVTNDLSDEKTTEIYKEWVASIMKDFAKKIKSLNKSDNEVVQQYAKKVDEHLLVSYDLRNNVKTYKLQLIDKQENEARSIPGFEFDAKTIKLKNKLQLTFNNDAPSQVETKNEAQTQSKEDVENDQENTSQPPAPGGKPGGRKIVDEINEDDTDGGFMLEETNENYEAYTEDSFNAEVQWLRNNLGGTGISLEDLGTIINNLVTNKQVLGYYKDKVIYADKALSKRGTIFHEAFHALFRDLFTQKERDFYLQKIKDKVGYIKNKEVEEFRNERGYFNKDDQQIRDLIYEEHLADGFKKWKLEQKQPAESWFKKLINKLSRIFDFFKSKESDIESLYRDFDEGRYSNRRAQASTISKEGVYSLAHGRPRLFVKEGAVDFTVDKTGVLNITLQNELVYKIINQMANDAKGSFTDKFTRAIKEVKKDYDIEKLIKSSDNPALFEEGIRAKYENIFNDALYVLGDSVPYILAEDLVGAEDATSMRTPEGANIKTLEIIRKEVENKIETLGIEKGFDSENLEMPEKEEDRVEKEKGGEFDTVHMNPLHGLSREFRSLFSVIPYQVRDEELGITINKMADGNMLFNAMIKIAANTPVNQILPSLDKAINSLKEDNDRTSIQLEAFGNFIKDRFGITDLSDPFAKPSKNIYLYKQFIETFFITELETKQVLLKTSSEGVSTANVFNASITQDIDNKKEKLKFEYETKYRKLKTDEEIAEFNDNFKKLQEYILNDFFRNVKDPLVINARSKVLNKEVNKLKKLLDAVNINLPKSLIRQSFLAIYSIENNLEFSQQSKQNRIDMETDQRLMKEGAYLQNDFFLALSTLSEENFGLIFSDTRGDKLVDLGNDRTRIKTINGVLRKAMKYVIKYDVNSAISVFQNAEGKKIWRYSKYTPPILLAQIVRENGIEAISDMYPLLKEWYSDNPLFDSSAENELFLENLQILANGGFRQEMDETSKDGTTFGNIDDKALYITNIIHFLNRETITKQMKDEQGKNQAVTITTYNRGRTQEEATTTNFLVTAKYQKLVTKEGAVSDVMIDNLVQMIKQEYNRIQREWETRNDKDKVRHNGYNNNIHPETKQPIEGDGYTLLDGKKVKLRAYQFKNFEHFFDLQKTPDDNKEIRQLLKNKLTESARSGVSFENAINSFLSEKTSINEAGDVIGVKDFLKDQLKLYMTETFNSYVKELKKTNAVVEQENELKSELVPGFISYGFGDPVSIQEAGYAGLKELLLDQHLNTFLNKLLVNQIFDGDIATGIKNAVEYFKRNKSGVISGNSMKSETNVRTAVVSQIEADIDKNDLLKYQQDVSDKTLSSNKEAIADGQAYHVLNHRIRMMDSWGRLDARSRQLLNKYKYKELTVSEIKELENKKIVLNSTKSATGGVFEYYKLSEHLISRVDVSHLVLKPNQSIDEAHADLDNLYSEIERLEDIIVGNPYVENAYELEQEIEKLYDQVHAYWEPKRSREKMHYLLNSMEKSGIDMLFDTNASKKTTLIPIDINMKGETNLKPSKSITNGMFKFMQVETSGIHDHITLPTQARQLLTTYINKLTTDKAYNNKSLKELADEYSQTLGDIATSRMNMLDVILTNKDGSLNIVGLYKTMYEGLKKQGADANTLKFLEIKNGEPKFNPNMPVIKKIFTYYYFSMFNDSVFSEDVSGRSDILVSSFGYDVLYDTLTGDIITTEMQNENPDLYKSDRYKTRALGVSVEEKNGQNVYTVEVIIPKPLAKNKALERLYLEKLNTFFSTRIPTEDRRSMVVSKVVDYMDAAYRNSIVVPQLVHLLAGSDLDVDKLYSHTFAHYINFNGEAHVYGDYGGYLTPSQGRFIEYVNYMINENKAIKDEIAAELENVTEKPVFNNDFLKLKNELGLTEVTESAEELKEKRKTLRISLDLAEDERKSLEAEMNTLFNLHIQNNDRMGSEGRNKWLRSREKYNQFLDQMDIKQEELNALREQIELVDNTFKLAALFNVLRKYNLPVTQSGLTKYIQEKGNPVVTVLQNKSLQHKIDILSNEKVFNEYYIQERSDTKPFKLIAEAIGASVEDVVNANSIYSITADVVANGLNSSNKDGIGISASFNKFLAFAEKNNITLTGDLFGTVDTNSFVSEFGTIADKIDRGSLSIHNNFLNTSGIRNIGGQLGMFADAAKDPIPSVLNLNPDTASVSNVLVAMSGNLQLGLLINKLPFIQKITDYVASTKSNAQNAKEKILMQNTRTLLKNEVVKPTESELSSKGRLGEIYILDEDGNPIEYREMFIETVGPNDQVTNKIANNEDVSIKDLGFVLRYEDGSIVTEEAAKHYLARLYINAITINDDIIRLGSILNLIKDQEPDFNKLDKLLENYDYFLSGQSVFGDSIAKVLLTSPEYKPLIVAAEKMSDHSKDLFIERSKLFKTLNGILISNFRGANNPKARQKISDQITKYIIINKVKQDLKKAIPELENKTDDASSKKKEIYENALKYFTADYWLNNNTFLEDLDYLSEKNPNNPFVEFLKPTSRNNLLFIEGLSRIKLDKDIADNIMNGFEALQKSQDRKTMILSRQLFYYLLVKDGLGYSNMSFLNYLSPDLKQYEEVSESLDNFQDILKNQEKYINARYLEMVKINANNALKPEQKEKEVNKIIDDIYNNYNKLFNDFFGYNKSEKINWVDAIIKKIISNAANQKYIYAYYGVKLNSDYIKESMNLLISNNVFSTIDSKEQVGGTKFDFLKFVQGDKFSLDFTKLIDTRNDERVDLLKIVQSVVDPKTRKIVAIGFPLIIKDDEGRVFKLEFLDEEDVSKKIIKGSMFGRSYTPIGKKAIYKQVLVEGTNNLLNFGFENDEAQSIYQNSQNTLQQYDVESAGDYLTETDELYNMGVEISQDNGTIVTEIGDDDDIPQWMLDQYEEKYGSKPPQHPTSTGQKELDEFDTDPEFMNLPDYLKEQFREERRKMAGKKQTGAPLGTIQLSVIEDWVQSGQATTTVRGDSYHNSFYKGDGVYKTGKGNLVNIKYKGLVKVQGNNIVGDNVSYTKDEFAKAEGFGDWANFQKKAQYAGVGLIGGNSVHLYEISPVRDFPDKDLNVKDEKCN